MDCRELLQRKEKGIWLDMGEYLFEYGQGSEWVD